MAMPMPMLMLHVHATFPCLESMLREHEHEHEKNKDTYMDTDKDMDTGTALSWISNLRYRYHKNYINSSAGATNLHRHLKMLKWCEEI
jgi:hypothetical protein